MSRVLLDPVHAWSDVKPIQVLPSLGLDGSLRWHVRSGDEIVTFVADTGEVYEHGEVTSEAVTAIVGALQEWYRTDVAEFGGLNIAKVRSELSPSSKDKWKL